MKNYILLSKLYYLDIIYAQIHNWFYFKIPDYKQDYPYVYIYTMLIIRVDTIWRLIWSKTYVGMTKMYFMVLPFNTLEKIGHIKAFRMMF